MTCSIIFVIPAKAEMTINIEYESVTKCIGFPED